MKVVGLTGGIGSGKSTVATIFEQLGVPIYDSDSKAKKIYNSAFVKEKVIELLGEHAYLNDVPDFAFIASKVFSNTELLSNLNAIIHPAVNEDFQIWLEEKLKQGVKWVIKESALLIETKAFLECHSVILVSCPEEIRIQRVMKRNAISRAEVKQRMKNQTSDALRLPHSEFCVVNDENSALIPQIIEIYRILNLRFGSFNA
jgi:dephospho-CoA kinase